MKHFVRLSRSSDIKQVQQNGRAYAAACIVVLVLPNPLQLLRIGTIASTAVGNAVQRNLARRRIKGCMTDLAEGIQPGNDLLFIARRKIGETDYGTLCSTIIRLLKQAQVWNRNDESSC